MKPLKNLKLKRSTAKARFTRYGNNLDTLIKSDEAVHEIQEAYEKYAESFTEVEKAHVSHTQDYWMMRSLLRRRHGWTISRVNSQSLHLCKGNISHNKILHPSLQVLLPLHRMMEVVLMIMAHAIFNFDEDNDDE